MFAVFPVMRQLHEALWHLGYAADRCPPGPLRDELRTAVRDSTALTAADEATLRQLDLPTHWRQVAGLLRRAGAALRAASGFDGPHHRGADPAHPATGGADPPRPLAGQLTPAHPTPRTIGTQPGNRSDRVRRCRPRP